MPVGLTAQQRSRVGQPRQLAQAFGAGRAVRDHADRAVGRQAAVEAGGAAEPAGLHAAQRQGAGFDLQAATRTEQGRQIGAQPQLGAGELHRALQRHRLWPGQRHAQCQRQLARPADADRIEHRAHARAQRCQARQLQHIGGVAVALGLQLQQRRVGRKVGDAAVHVVQRVAAHPALHARAVQHGKPALDAGKG